MARKTRRKPKHLAGPGPVISHDPKDFTPVGNRPVYPEPVVGYAPGQIKKQAGVSVQLLNGRQFLFAPGDSSWAWVHHADRWMLEVTEAGRIVFQAPVNGVMCVTGPITIFVEAVWK